jgi:hypothetical protein
VRPYSFSAVLRASGPVFFCCAPGLIFGGTEGVPFRFHILRSHTRFRWYRGCPISFSCFPLLDMFSAVPRASGPIFMFCATGIVFGGAECIGSCFLVLRARTHFRRYRARRVPFSCFALSDSFNAEPRASGPVLMFYPPGLIFDGTEGVGSRFLVLRAWNHFRRYRGRRSSFLILRSRTHFRRYRVRRVLFSCFELPNSFSAIPRSSGAVFLFCATELVFDGTEGVGSSFHVLRYGLIFGGTGGIRPRFQVLSARTPFRRYRGRQIPFLCFPLPEMFSAVQRVSGPFFHVLRF